MGDGSDGYASPSALAGYALVLIDECYHLSAALFRHFNETYKACDRVPAAVLAGDKHQMGAPGGTPAFLLPMWQRATFSTRLRIDPRYAQRCKDPTFRALLNSLRLRQPAPRGGAGWTVTKICRGRKAWRGEKPTVAAIATLFAKYPDTTVLCISRRGAHEINELAVEAKFGGSLSLITLPGDVESNPANYDRQGKIFTTKEQLKPLRVPIYKGMFIYLTKNVRKDVDFVNGMLARIEDYDDVSRGLLVVTTTGHRFRMWNWTDKDLHRMMYYPIRPGYASTIIKFQGAELKHVTAYLDVPGVPGAAYTALSRVATAKDYLIGGNVTPAHFTPRIAAYARHFTHRRIEY